MDLPLRLDGEVNLLVLKRHSDFLNDQELWEDDYPTHNLHVRTCTTSTKGTSAIVSTSNWGIYGCLNNQDHREQHLRKDMDVDYLR